MTAPSTRLAEDHDGTPTRSLQLRVNGAARQCQVPDDLLLIDLLRDGLGLKGCHCGCDTAQCGACTVLLDGVAVKACNMLAIQARHREISTIEGLAPSSQTLHPMQLAFSRHHGLQCGYCTPGFVMRAMAMVDEPVPASPEAVRQALGGNLCRCTGYEGIVAAICEGLTVLRAQRGQEPQA